MEKTKEHRSRPDYPITRSPDLRILYVSYPLLTVSDESAGGAEQMLWTLEHEMARSGVNTTVAASAGSQVSGELLVTGEPCSLPDDFERRSRAHQQRIVEFVQARECRRKPFDLIHDKSGSFWPRASELDVPVLATLHLPRHFYSPQLFENIPENVYFNCVSQSQALGFADLDPVVVPNGILLDRFQPNFGPRNGLLWLGRICEEKAPHLALEIAARTNQPIILAGQVYPFSYHQQYFERQILPRLAQMPDAVFAPSPSFKQKDQLLREAKAVLIASVVDETSSLVVMEAAACGTPVIAFRRGALPEIVEHNVTGFIVDSVEEAVEAFKEIELITPSACIRGANENFNSHSMTEQYAQIYREAVRRYAGSTRLNQ